METTEMAKGDKSAMKIKTKRNRIEYRLRGRAHSCILSQISF